MTIRSRLPLILSGLIPTLVAAALCLSRPSLSSSIDSRVYDALIRLTPLRPPSGRIVIVDVDERSLSSVGQWPWRRDLIAKLIDRLRDLGASTVALDVIFAEADRYEGEPSPDAVLAHTLSEGRVILGYGLTFDRASSDSTECLLHPAGLALVQRDDHALDDPVFRATGSVCNLPALARAAGASGFLNAVPDSDGILRRVPLLMEFSGDVYPALSLAAVAATTGARDMALHVVNVNRSLLALRNGSVPLDGKGNVLLRYRGGKRTFPYVSAVAVLNGETSPEIFKDKVVFVGTTALGTREVVSTPLDTLFTGVEVQATVADNLLQQDFIRRPEYGIAVEAQLVMVLGLVAMLLVARFGAVWGVIGSVVGAAALWSAAVVLMSTAGVFLSPLYPTLGLAGSLAAMTIAQSRIERIRADRAGQEKTTAQRVMVQALLSLVEIRDVETGKHSRRTQQYTKVLAKALASHPEFSDYLTPERIELISALAPLHDIGKVGVPDRLLNKPGELTPDELAEMRKHPVYGRDVILKTEQEVGVRDDLTLGIAKDIAYTHHEKWDGTGYPEGLRGTQIPIPGRLIAVVDVYDAAHTRRLYQKPRTHDDVVALIVKGRGTHFDPAVVDAFVRVSPILRNLSDGDGR